MTRAPVLGRGREASCLFPNGVRHSGQDGGEADSASSSWCQPPPDALHASDTCSNALKERLRIFWCSSSRSIRYRSTELATNQNHSVFSHASQRQGPSEPPQTVIIKFSFNVVRAHTHQRVPGTAACFAVLRARRCCKVAVADASIDA